MAPAPIPIEGVIQHYAWGDPSFLPEMLGVDADGQPWAELWLGTHPNGPASTTDGRPLRDVTGELPYLLKVLAAAEPLSLQAHPDADQAADGFARGVYPDAQPKPELLCALTSFDALCGIRPTEATLALLDAIGADELASAIGRDGVGPTISALYRGELDTASTLQACSTTGPPGPDPEGHPGAREAALVRQLARRFPGDPSVVVTLLLNRVHLAPGEALHLTAGNLHAYLHGAGIELMSASDNVVRGGLTVKPVDVDELLRVLDPTPLVEPVMRDAATTGEYPLPEAGCTLRRLEPGVTHTSTGHELGIGLDGASFYLPPAATFSPIVTTFVVTTP